MNKRTGIGVSPGIAIGRVYKFDTGLPEPDTRSITPEEAEGERAKWRDTVTRAAEHLKAMAEAQDTEEKRAIFSAHLTILEDPFLEQAAFALVDGGQNIQLALKNAVEDIAAQFEALDDEYLKERAADIRDVYGLLIGLLTGVERGDLSHLPGPAVVVAENLSPSQTANMDRDNVLGFVTGLGGRTSHTSIMAQSMGLPAVVGCRGIFDQVEDGDEIVLDGAAGTVVIAPDGESRAQYEKAMADFLAERERLRRMISLPGVTRDGKAVTMAANAGGLSDIEMAVSLGAEGIGLFRTEFLYMGKTQMPTEQEQYETYRRAAELMDGKTVVIRTLDIGGDKALPYLDMAEEENPFLGCRGIRLCFNNPEVFKTQLLAILRASAHGKIAVMFPMVISLEEITQCRTLIDEARAELDARGERYDPDMEIGIMVETPAAVLMADVLARHVDFFSIGTNDLTQYVLAVDRGNEAIADLYQPMHPAVLRAIDTVAEAAHRHGKWCGMCGELAGNADKVPLLIGLGLDELSASPPLVLGCKEAVRGSDCGECRTLAEEVLRLETKGEVLTRIQ